MTRATPSYTIHDGFRMPMGFPPEGFASGLAYEAQPGDIVVAAYPKCGTTWVQHIVYLLLHHGEPLPAGQSMAETFPQLEEVGREVVGALAEPRCIKTHLPYAMTPMHREARYIYVARNPFDCAVSFYHHTRGFSQHYDFAEGSFDDYFECFLRGEVDFGDYFDNLISWYEHRDDQNLLFLTYEEMKADLRPAVRAIGEFISCAAAHDEATLERVLEHSGIESMRKDQGRWSSRRPDHMPAFVRKGEVGDWMNHFSAGQARRLAGNLAERAAGTDLETLWREVLRAVREFA